MAALLPLDSDPSHNIRVLELRPGAGNDPIICNLSTDTLDSPQSYEAVSYVWGLEPPVDTISVNDMEIPVRANLAACLRHIRYRQGSRFLWVDTLCIDQSNDREKGAQVSLMPRIYGAAMRTLIWLGGDELLPEAIQLQLLNDPDQTEERVRLSNGFSLLERLSRSRDSHFEFCHADVLDSVCLSQTMCLPWWPRVWVVQEVVVPERLSWCLALPNCHGKLQLLELPTSPFKLHPSFYRMLPSGYEILSFRYFQVMQPNELLSRLWMMRAKHATDSRDKIYATLGLIRSDRSTMLKPDYTADVRLLYRSVVLDNIVCSGRLDVFMGSDREKDSLPSWATDWRKPFHDGEEARRILSDLSKQVYAASLYRKAKAIHHTSRHQLQVSGIIVDAIRQVGNIGNDGYDSPSRVQQMETFNTWKDLIESSIKIVSPYSASSSEDVFWRTTLGDVFLAEGERLSAYNVSHEQGESSIRRIRDDDRPIWEHWWAWRNGRIELENTPPGIEVPEVRNIGSSVTRASTGRRLFVTRRGYIGLCPSSGRVGDVVAVLLGGSTPFILSARSKRERALENANSELQVQNTSVLIGDCYVHGLMDGEALRGEETDDALGVEDIFLE